MAIEWQVLGQAGSDNALHVTVDSGQSRESLLFDCGEGCLRDLRTSAIQSVAHLFFSHFHMDHVSGFDTFFRHNYNKPDAPIQVWGPPGTIEVMWHRFRGFSWNLHADQPGEWIVKELSGRLISTAGFFTREAFAAIHRRPEQPLEDPVIYRSGTWHMENRLLPHGSIPSAAYRLVEEPRMNIDAGRLRSLEIVPGPWLKELTDAGIPDTNTVDLNGRAWTFGELRRELLTSTPGESLAYLTDFRIEPGTEIWDDIAAWLTGTTTLVCECHYRQEDSSLAIQNSHMTADLVGRLAADAGVGRLVLQHFSKRYSLDERNALHDEAKLFFPGTEFPPGWSNRG